VCSLTSVIRHRHRQINDNNTFQNLIQYNINDNSRHFFAMRLIYVVRCGSFDPQHPNSQVLSRKSPRLRPQGTLLFHFPPQHAACLSQDGCSNCRAAACSASSQPPPSLLRVSYSSSLLRPQYEDNLPRCLFSHGLSSLDSL
jgi:hypothetical protein